jgi:hypothetical protein
MVYNVVCHRPSLLEFEYQYVLTHCLKEGGKSLLYLITLQAKGLKLLNL